jgi:hypothetical protein
MTYHSLGGKPTLTLPLSLKEREHFIPSPLQGEIKRGWDAYVVARHAALHPPDKGGRGVNSSDNN